MHFKKGKRKQIMQLFIVIKSVEREKRRKVDTYILKRVQKKSFKYYNEKEFNDDLLQMKTYLEEVDHYP